MYADSLRRRIVSSFVRRNIRGWGRPLDYTVQRLRLGGLFGLTALVVAVIDALMNGPQGALAGQGATAVFLGLLFLLTLMFFAGMLWSYLPAYLQATRQPPERVTGRIDAAICNPQAFVPLARDPYHFITLRLPNGRLRPFAIDAALHNQVCHPGQQVTLDVIPGIERVTAISE
jgi:hypothetical protein